MLPRGRAMLERIDYEAVGLISGLEVHQQLLTREKLFCRCPGGLYTQTHDGEVLRHMRPTLSELGEYDGTALMEFKTRKEILYLLNRANVCTYEMDDTPPFPVNQEAIDIAIQLCLMMNMDVIDEVHIARKQYLDGSIPTGFQRTAIIGVNGFIPFKGRKLSISHLSLEEDSCREVSDIGHRIVFRTDRLGMPLTETVTGPDLRTPEEVRDAIRLCSLTSRSSMRVRTGIGAGRQDVNVSVRGGRRVEIKGVSRAAYAVKLVHNEAIRQVNLLKLQNAMAERGLNSPDSICMHSKDITDLFAGSKVDFAQRAIKAGGKVYGVKISGVREFSQFPTQPGITFLDELSGRVRVIACLDEPPIILSGDRLPEFSVAHRTRERVRKRLRAQDNDDFFLVCGPERDCITAAEEIRLRFVDATQGVPNETRQALLGGYTTFERILPGPDRMYPDTDLPPTKIDQDRIDSLRKELKMTPWEREERYSKWGVPVETTHSLIRRGQAETMDAVIEKTGVDGLIAAIEIGQRAKAMKRAGIPIQRLDTEKWIEIFDLYTDGKIPREGIQEVAKVMSTHSGLTGQEACKAAGIHPVDETQWKTNVDSILSKMTEVINGYSDEKAIRLVTGKATTMLKGKAPAKDVALYVKDKLTEGRA